MTETPHPEPTPPTGPAGPTPWSRLRATLAGAAVAALVAVGLGGFAVGRATADDAGTQQPGFQQQGPPGGLNGGLNGGLPGGQTGSQNGQAPGGQLPGAPAQGGGTSGSPT
ncbi:hypothetical protein G5V58_09335 [Nocardioides anomalus]|uniref:Uncharacterized protein n=1 Tax=Nocardioides anomalus TaxID=2712223 RepID=A0A6G6WCJ3_9ACTN|nr:hypothetical protein [Nocardioides anomalus]QIG42939.1 hypothetical protein G5V58_09335 [Nocardioides anomalus]